MKVRNGHAMVALAGVLSCAAPAAAQDWTHEIQAHLQALTRAEALAHAALDAQREGELQRQRDAARARDQLERQREAQARQRQLIAERARQLQQGWAEVTGSFSRTVRLGRDGTLDLENIAGDVVITGGRGSDVRIEAVRRMRTPSETQARRLLQQLRIDVVQRGGNVEVRTQYPRVRSASGEVAYTIAVPASANVTVRTMSGDVRVSNLNGELRAEAVSGDVVAASVRRVRLVKTMSGNVQLTDGESDELTASTMSGDVVVNNLKGRLFDLQSVTGSLRLTNVEPDRVHLRSMNGDIEYVGRLSRSGRYEFQSHLGDIRVTPTNNQGFDIQASTFGGSFRSEYALRITEDSAAGARRTGSRMLRGTFGDAGAAITALSFGGDIVLVRR